MNRQFKMFQPLVSLNKNTKKKTELRGHSEFFLSQYYCTQLESYFPKTPWKILQNPADKRKNTKKDKKSDKTKQNPLCPNEPTLSI